MRAPRVTPDPAQPKPNVGCEPGSGGLSGSGAFREDAGVSPASADRRSAIGGPLPGKAGLPSTSARHAVPRRMDSRFRGNDGGSRSSPSPRIRPEIDQPDRLHPPVQDAPCRDEWIPASAGRRWLPIIPVTPYPAKDRPARSAPPAAPAPRRTPGCGPAPSPGRGRTRRGACARRRRRPGAGASLPR